LNREKKSGRSSCADGDFRPDVMFLEDDANDFQPIPVVVFPQNHLPLPILQSRLGDQGNTCFCHVPSVPQVNSKVRGYIGE